MSNFNFTADSITVAGKTFPAAYSITKTGAAMAFVTVPGAEDVQRVRFDVSHAEYAAALAAAKAEKAAHEAEAAKAAEVATEDEPAAEMVRETTTEEPAPAEERETIPEGYTATTTAAALEKAGFYFSKAMNSYNKKLTCKAHRAALALSGELRALYA